MRGPDSAGLIELLEIAESSREASLDRRLIKALGHPVRVRALEILNARVASPSELAKELGEPLGNVAYHVKILEENDAIELVRTAPVRGALEHFYRASVNTQIAQTALDLDEQGYREVVDLLSSVVERAKAIQKQSASRLAEASAEERKPQPTALMVMHVRRAEDDGASAGNGGAG
jgi:DNA-binding transcriptional ArsR family regulator